MDESTLRFFEELGKYMIADYSDYANGEPIVEVDIINDLFSEHLPLLSYEKVVVQEELDTERWELRIGGKREE